LLRGQTFVGGNQSGVWTLANSPYVLNTVVTVPDDETLVIEPGVVIEARSGGASLIVTGSLVAQGTVDSPITLQGIPQTANPFHSHGGNLTFNAGSSGNLKHFIVDRMGYNDRTAVVVNSSGVTIDSSQVSDSDRTGLSIPVNVSPTITNSDFSNNTVDLYAHPGSVSNVIGNTECLIILSQGTITADAAMHPQNNAGADFFLERNTTVAANNELVINPGTVLELKGEGFAGIEVNGTLTAIGTPQDSIIFRGKASGFGPFVNSVINYARVEQIGFFGAGIQIRTTSARVENTYIKDCRSTGLIIEDNISPVVRNCRFSGSPKAMRIYSEGGENIGGLDSTDIYIINSTVDEPSTLSMPGVGARYLLEASMTINQGNTLTVQPGVELYFTSYSSNLFVSGTLIAGGTATDSIKFIGLPNPAVSVLSTHGGYVRFRNTSENSRLDYLVVDRLGDGNFTNGSRAFWIESPSVSINHATFKNNERTGVQFETDAGGSIMNSSFENHGTAGIFIGSEVNPQISNINFVNNSKDVRAYAEGLGDLSDLDSADIYIVNSTVDELSTFSRPGIGSRYLMEGDIAVSTGDTLIIEPGVELYFTSYSTDLQVSGTLLAEGTATDSIKFIGLPNPAVTPASTHGGYVRFRTSSQGSRLDYLVVDRLGDENITSGSRAFWIESPSVSINHATFKNNERTGVQFETDAGGSIMNSSFENHGTTGIFIESERCTRLR